MPNPARQDAAVFEGAFDFLSALAYYQRDRPASNVLVLNSVAMIDRAVCELQGQGITKLSTYLDHDPAGEEAWVQLKGRGPWEMRDASDFYRGFKDVSEFLEDRERPLHQRHDRTRDSDLER